MSDDSQTTAGWIIFIAALGAMFGLIGIDIAKLHDWNEVSTPLFIGSTFIHFSTVVAAFVGGKLIPTTRAQTGRITDLRVTDAKVRELNMERNNK